MEYNSFKKSLALYLLIALPLPFGGKIISVIPPTPPVCLFTTLVVGPPRGGAYVLVPTAKKYLHLLQEVIPKPGQWVLGLGLLPALPPPVCGIPILTVGSSKI